MPRDGTADCAVKSKGRSGGARTSPTLRTPSLCGRRRRYQPSLATSSSGSGMCEVCNLDVHCVTTWVVRAVVH